MTKKQDMMMAIELGVNALGFILAKSPRQVDLETVYKLTAGLPPFVSTVGVVVNPSEKKLNKIIDSGLFDYIQFHGGEDPDLIAELSIKSIKAISISTQEDLDQIEKYKDVDYLLFDTKTGSEKGGTGKSFDWSLIKNYELPKPYILAGGLGPDNILEALTKVKPAAIDLNSKVEISPGIKDRALLSKTIAEINNFSE